jgi:hypothetical protein
MKFMSSPKTAAAKAAAVKSARTAKPRSKMAAKTVATRAKAADPKPRVIRAAGKPARTAAPMTELGIQAARLATEIERAIVDGRTGALPTEQMQPLMSALCKLYAAQVEEGTKATPVEEGQIVSPTAIMLTASGLLRAANLAVFELGMWQSWTGR